MSSGFSAGGFPSKMNVPGMGRGATAMPGHNDMATRTATSHGLYPNPPMLGSLVIVHLSPRRRGAAFPASSKRSVGAGTSVSANSTSDPPYVNILDNRWQTATSPYPSSRSSPHQGRRGTDSCPISGVLEHERFGQPWVA